MANYWLSLEDLSDEGRTYHIRDQKIWTDPISEFNLSYSLIEPLDAVLFCLLQEEGCLVQGKLKGKISLPCSRCAEPAEYTLDVVFQIFEIFAWKKTKEDIGPQFLRDDRGFLEIDAAGILWEQFILHLPDKPLCSDQCLGLCPHCGQNLNFGQCKCHEDQVDPRLEIFRKLKIK